MFTVHAFAGGPLRTEPIPGTQDKPKLVSVESAKDVSDKTTKHWTIGIGLGGNPLIAITEKTSFGYPVTEYGVTSVLGYGVTWFSGQPDKDQISNALQNIRSDHGEYIDEKELPSLVRQGTGITSLNYVQLGTLATILPINAEIGTMWILTDNWRTRLGFGLPTLISFGIAYDF